MKKIGKGIYPSRDNLSCFKRNIFFNIFFFFLLPVNHVTPGRTSTDVLDRNTTHATFNELNVRTSIGREIVIAQGTHGVALPSGEGNVLDLHVVQGVRVGRKRVLGSCAVRQDVRNTDLDLVEVVEDVELGEVQGGVVVDSLGVAGEDEIEPTAAAATTGCHTEFLAGDLQLFTVFVELFGWEGARSDTGGVGLDHTDDGGDAGWVQRETLDSTTQAGGRRGHEGVSSVVQVEHECVGTLNQSVGRVLVFLEEAELVNDVGLQDFAVFLNLLSVYFIFSFTTK